MRHQRRSAALAFPKRSLCTHGRTAIPDSSEKDAETRFHLPAPGTASLAEGPQQHLDFPSHQLFDCGGVSEPRTSAGSTLGARTLPHLTPPFCLVEQTRLFKVHIIITVI